MATGVVDGDVAELLDLVGPGASAINRLLGGYKKQLSTHYF